MIRAALADTLDTWQTEPAAADFARRDRKGLKHVRAVTKIRAEVPGVLGIVKTQDRSMKWYGPVNLGLTQFPVVVGDMPSYAKARGTHWVVASRADYPNASRLNNALAELNSMEKGWAGRSTVFISPRSSSLKLDQVLSVVKSHLGEDALQPQPPA
jgi:hypothetical protein